MSRIPVKTNPEKMKAKDSVYDKDDISELLGKDGLFSSWRLLNK